jgi:membrane-associated phospholipid phosphatase
VARSAALTVEREANSRFYELTRDLRFAERVILVFLLYVVVAALAFPLAWRERLTLLGLNVITSALVVALARFSSSERSKLLVTLRDWLPCFLILLAYRESGIFFRPDPTHHLDYLFVSLDHVLLQNHWVEGFLQLSSPWFQRYLEFAYFLCYPLVPLGLAALYLARCDHARRASSEGHDFSRARTTGPAMPEGASDPGEWQRAIDHFWTAVLLAALSCYVLYPFFPLTPPRELFNDLPGPAVAPLIRKTNFWLLGQYGVGASLFPSGHVAATTAMALALHKYLPRVGVVFLIAAASIALATVYGRYHYAADAIAGIVVGAAAAFIANHVHTRERG